MKKLMRLVLGASCMVLGAVAAFAEPSVEITKVKLADARDGTVEYAYTVSGDFEGWLYDLVVKVTSDDGTKSVFLTNKFVKAGSVNTNVNVKALLGKPYPGVSLFAQLEKRSNGVQIWANGPYWAECNVGGTLPGDYGDLYTFNGDKAKEAAESLGAGWRLPTYDELVKFFSYTSSTRKWETCKNSAGADIAGCRFTSAVDPSKSIFLPAAGVDEGDGRGRLIAGRDGFYWSSDVRDANGAWKLEFSESFMGVTNGARTDGMSVRAVRDAAK